MAPEPTTPSPPSAAVRIVEVSPRDGLQNIPHLVPTAIKIELIRRLVRAGLVNVEATSFVSPKWIPQLADNTEVLRAIAPLLRDTSLRLPVLIPNLRGLDGALGSGVKEVAVFVSASESFSRKNTNCSVEEALERAREVCVRAREEGVAVRGYISCVIACPYDGPTPSSAVLRTAHALLEMGCYEVSLGDTLGTATPQDIETLLAVLLSPASPAAAANSSLSATSNAHSAIESPSESSSAASSSHPAVAIATATATGTTTTPQQKVQGGGGGIPSCKLAGHFHDTHGQAVANVLKAYEMGLRTFDGSVAGLGGCPFAVVSSSAAAASTASPVDANKNRKSSLTASPGNVATEDLVRAFHHRGVQTGVDLGELVATGRWISEVLGRRDADGCHGVGGGGGGADEAENEKEAAAAATTIDDSQDKTLCALAYLPTLGKVR